MQSILRILSTAGLLVALVLCATPGAVLANSARTMRRDQEALGLLVQEGVLNPNDANALAKKAYNRVSGSLLHNNPVSNLFSGTRALNVMSTFQTSSTAKRASKQIRTLQKDGVLSQKQAQRLTMELGVGVNATRNQAMMNSWNGGFPGNSYGYSQ